MPATTRRIGPGSGAHQVICEAPGCGRPLNVVVGSEAHADNLAAKHNREYHADEPRPGEAPSYDVSAAASAYLATVRTAYAVGRTVSSDLAVQAYAAQTAAEEVWHALTGLSGQAALDAAEHAAANQTIAHPAPF